MKILIFCLTLLSTTVQAESYVYITDLVDIPLRSDKSFGDNIVRSLTSGPKLSILQTTDDGWTQVQFENTKGWIISRYLSNSPAAKERLDELTQTYNKNQLLLTQQQQTNQKLQQQLKALKALNADLSIQKEKAQAEKAHIEQVYKNALKLEHQNERLNQQLLQLKGEIQLLQAANVTEQETNSRNWFIIGALVLLAGLMIGLVLPNFFSKKRY